MHAPKMQSRITSVFSIARRNATSCASGAIGKLDEVEGGGAIKGRSRFSHCFLRRCVSVVKADQPPDLIWRFAGEEDASIRQRSRRSIPEGRGGCDC